MGWWREDYKTAKFLRMILPSLVGDGRGIRSKKRKQLDAVAAAAVGYKVLLGRLVCAEATIGGLVSNRGYHSDFLRRLICEAFVKCQDSLLHFANWQFTTRLDIIPIPTECYPLPFVPSRKCSFKCHGSTYRRRREYNWIKMHLLS